MKFKVLWIAGMILAATAGQLHAAMVTFSGSTLSTGAGNGFNNQNNPYFITADGQYRAEAFWLNTDGHFHINTFSGNQVEANHNYAASWGMSQLQGIRITRVDNGMFNLVSMDLLGRAAVGSLSNFTTGLGGSWTLYTELTGSTSNLTTVSFGTAFSNVTEIFIADPRAAGFTTSSTNYWDNITMAQTAVPEPASIVMLGTGALGLIFKTRKRRQTKQTA